MISVVVCHTVVTPTIQHHWPTFQASTRPCPPPLQCMSTLTNPHPLEVPTLHQQAMVSVCTRVCTTSRDRAGKMAVTRSVLVMMSPTTSTAAELDVQSSTRSQTPADWLLIRMTPAVLCQTVTLHPQCPQVTLDPPHLDQCSLPTQSRTQVSVARPMLDLTILSTL